jgi:hypothetical protein
MAGFHQEDQADQRSGVLRGCYCRRC